ncbi:unnamed protein product [Lactuca saligna]|uniref:Uncharacterized protein n=1 Tax=Lactuca saligna TaxID=75948 RepID=A0AA35YVK6_LACSI|nr:unnamed protein product [Lactuca saligna]
MSTVIYVFSPDTNAVKGPHAPDTPISIQENNIAFFDIISNQYKKLGVEEFINYVKIYPLRYSFSPGNDQPHPPPPRNNPHPSPSCNNQPPLLVPRNNPPQPPMNPLPRTPSPPHDTPPQNDDAKDGENRKEPVMENVTPLQLDLSEE